MKEEYKITVVVPVYNAEKYLNRCVKSVIAQSYESWELILVDDGSTDKSYKLCDSYMKNDSRIIVIHQANQGVSAARNKGIDYASGDILVFLDADDWLETNALKIINTYWDKQLQLLLFDYYDAKTFESKKRRKFFFVDKLEIDETFIRQNNLVDMIIPGQTIKYQTREQGMLAVWGKAFSCSYIKSNFIKFPDGIFMGEDYVFNVCAVQNMMKVRYISRPLYNYFMNETSVTFMRFKVNESLIRNYKNCCQYVKLADQAVQDDDQINTYEKYVLSTMKTILWRTASEKDDKKKKLGRNYCMYFLNEISMQNQALVDYCFLWLLRHRMIGFVEKMICMKKIFAHENERNA